MYRDTETIHKAAMAVVAGLSFPRWIVKGVKCLIRRSLYDTANRAHLDMVKRAKEKSKMGRKKKRDRDGKNKGREKEEQKEQKEKEEQKKRD